MKLFDLIKTFQNDDSGAVTVDWVVLTAAIVGLGIAVVATVGGGISDMGSSISDALSDNDLSGQMDGLGGTTTTDTSTDG